MDKTAHLLKKNGPMLSGDLARLYEQEYGVSNEAARKAISRSKPPVKKLYKIKFDKNQLFYYLEEQFMSEKYVNALMEAIENHSKIVYTYIQAFIAQNGVVSKKLLPAFTAAPVGKVKGHRIHFDVLQKLIDSQIIRDNGDESYSIAQTFYGSVNTHRARGLEIAKNVITRDFNNWARDINLVAYDQGKCLFETPDFGQFQWAYTAPSYIQPLYSSESQKPGFIVADVFFGRTATVNSIRFFVEKINVLRSFKNIPSFLPVFLVDKIDREALEYLKENKVMVAILNNLFSTKYTELLENLVLVFTNASAIISSDPSQLYRLFETLQKNEGRYNNIAGDLFELLVGSHFSYLGCQFLKLQEEIIDFDTGKKKELDLLVCKDGKYIVIECKAQKSKLDEKFVRKWLNENIPFTRKYLKDRYQTDNIEFQLWSVSGFDDVAVDLLKNAKYETKKYEINYYDRNQMIAMAKVSRDQHFVDIMNQHFLVEK